MAQLISLKKLEKLARRPLAEAERTSRFYWKFSDMFQDKIEELSRGKMHLSEDAALHQAYKEMKDEFLRKNCPPIEYIDEGSSRAAYALDGGQCLKIATRRSGVGQNEAEVRNMEQSGKLGIFPMLYDCADDYTSILVECVSPCDYQHNKTILNKLGIDASSNDIVQDIADLLDYAVRKLPEDFDDLFQIVMDNTGNNVWYDLCEAILEPRNEAQKILRNLAIYTMDNNKDFDVVDVGQIRNWGFAVRNGKVVPIVLDAGFSPEVRDNWY